VDHFQHHYHFLLEVAHKEIPFAYHLPIPDDVGYLLWIKSTISVEEKEKEAKMGWLAGWLKSLL